MHPNPTRYARCAFCAVDWNSSPSIGDDRSSSPSSLDFDNVGILPPRDVLLSDDNFVSPFFSKTDPFRYPQLRHAFINVTITREVSKLLGGASRFYNVCKSYFETVHTWLPILSKSQVTEDVKNVWTEPKADIALLARCVYLITQIPDDAVTESMRTSLYAKTKTIYTLAESAGVLSIALIQSGLLITLYELGHGLGPSGYISIASCARSAVTLGIDCPETAGLPQGSNWRLLEERRRVWWGIVILDR